MDDEPQRSSPGQRPLWLVMVAVAVVALGVRAVMVANGGDPGRHRRGYDQGVYYSASEAVAWGVLPYRDFLFLHPPGILVTLAPLGLVASLTRDFPSG